LRVCEEVLTTFRSLKNLPVLICPNHSAHEDPAVLFILSTLVSQQFRFLTARESFGARNTWYSKWLQKIGCYSVERGVADTHAFKATRNLLVQGPNKIVIFPEGEVTHQNNYLTEFENGPEHIGLSAMEDLKKNHSSARIFIVPLALKYKYLIDMRPSLAEAMITIETALGYKSNSDSLKKRIETAFTEMLRILEAAHNCSGQTKKSFEERVCTLRERLIFESESFLHVELSDELPQMHKIHHVEKQICREKLVP
jgi:1-acyl-sn-glycerol-3-phosphate acyltransferase